jgi:3-oxoacyl-[acyl-carrier protein] reductase
MKIAFVTGAARGLGQGIAIGMARRGYQVVCADLTGCGDTVALIEQEGLEAKSVALDISDSSAVDRCIAETVATIGSIDVLVNNAGIYSHSEVAEISDDDLHNVVAVNLFGTFYMCRAVIPHMKAKSFGRIINIASQVGKVARFGDSVYAASKAGVILMTQALALELGRHNITANSICPGTIWTEMSELALRSSTAGSGKTFSQAKQDYIDQKIPVGRYGEPTDIANLVAWLASDEAAFITGSAQNLTGGEQVFF